MQIPEPIVHQNQESPAILFFILLVFTIIVGNLLGSGLNFLYAQMMGYDLLEAINGINESSSLADRNFVRTINIISHVFTFTVPALFVAFFYKRRNTFQYLKLIKQPLLRNIVLASFFILASFPFAQFTYWLNSQIPLPSWMGSMEDSATDLMKGLLVMDSPIELFFNLVVIAVVPSIGEELLFRGLIQKKLYKLVSSPHTAILLTSILFSAFHLQFEGFLPRLVLGLVLGYSFYWTKNLWVPIIAHIVINGVQVLGNYYFKDKIGGLDLEQIDAPNWMTTFFSTILCLGLAYLLSKNNESSSETVLNQNSINP